MDIPVGSAGRIMHSSSQWPACCNHRQRKEIWDGGQNQRVWGMEVAQRDPGVKPQ